MTKENARRVCASLRVQDRFYIAESLRNVFDKPEKSMNDLLDYVEKARLEAMDMNNVDLTGDTLQMSE